MPTHDKTIDPGTELVEIDTLDTRLVSGAGWGGAVFGAFMGAEFGPAGMVVGAVVGHMVLD